MGSLQKFPLPWLSLKFPGGSQGSCRVLPKNRILLGELHLTKGGFWAMLVWMQHFQQGCSAKRLPQVRECQKPGMGRDCSTMGTASKGSAQALKCSFSPLLTKWLPKAPPLPGKVKRFRFPKWEFWRWIPVSECTAWVSHRGYRAGAAPVSPCCHFLVLSLQTSTSAS